MIKEYKIVKADINAEYSYSFENTETELNDLAAQGWQIKMSHKTHDSSTTIVFIMERDAGSQHLK